MPLHGTRRRVPSLFKIIFRFLYFSCKLNPFSVRQLPHRMESNVMTCLIHSNLNCSMYHCYHDYYFFMVALALDSFCEPPYFNESRMAPKAKRAKDHGKNPRKNYQFETTQLSGRSGKCNKLYLYHIRVHSLYSEQVFHSIQLNNCSEFS